MNNNNVMNPFANQGNMQPVQSMGGNQQPMWINPYMGNAVNTLAQQGMNQMPGQRRQASSLSGRIINDPSEIVPEDIPMNGTSAIFPCSNGQYILVKTWDGNFNVKDTVYVRQDPPDQETQKRPSEFEIVLGRLERIESMLTSQNSKSAGKTAPKKEEVKNEQPV